MKIEIGDNNKIKNSNIGIKNKIESEKSKGNKLFVEIIVGIFVTVVGGIILYYITK